MRKSLILACLLTAATLAPTLSFAAMACDDATLARAQSAVSSMSAKKQSKFYGKLEDAKKAKASGQNGKCSKLLSTIIGKS